MRRSWYCQVQKDCCNYIAVIPYRHCEAVVMSCHCETVVMSRHCETPFGGEAIYPQAKLGTWIASAFFLAMTN